MSEHWLTDEQVDCVIEYANVWPAFPLAVEVKALRAERVKLVGALQNIRGYCWYPSASSEEIYKIIDAALAQPAESGATERELRIANAERIRVSNGCLVCTTGVVTETQTGCSCTCGHSWTHNVTDVDD